MADHFDCPYKFYKLVTYFSCCNKSRYYNTDDRITMGKYRKCANLV